MKKFLKRFYKSKFFGIICGLSFSLLSIGTAMIVAGTTPVRGDTVTYGGGFYTVNFVDTASSEVDGGYYGKLLETLKAYAYYEDSVGRKYPAGVGDFDYINDVGLWEYNGIDYESLMRTEELYGFLTFDGWGTLFDGKLTGKRMWGSSGNFNPDNLMEYKELRVDGGQVDHDDGDQTYSDKYHNDDSIDVYARWKAKRQVSFRGWGGTFDVTNFDGYTIANDVYEYTFGDDYGEWFLFQTHVDEETGYIVDGLEYETYGVRCPVVPIPQKEGYLFGGWYQYDNGNGFQYYSPSGKLTYAGGNPDEDAETSGASITLYAYWIDTWASPGNYEAPSGSGTYLDPYLIASAKNLAWMSYQTNYAGNDFSGKYFKQTADIDLSGEYWYPIGITTPFEGRMYDGGGYTISNMQGVDITDVNDKGEIEYLMQYAGLFAVVNRGDYGAGIIKNITIENFKLFSSAYAGAITAKSDCIITNCNVLCSLYDEDGDGCYDANADGSLKSSGEIWTIGATYVGGLAGYGLYTEDSTIQNCSIICKQTDGYIGGLIGTSVSVGLIAERCKAIDVYIRVDARLKCRLGGIGGNGPGEVRNCYYDATNLVEKFGHSMHLSGVGGDVGGLCGYSFDDVCDSSVSGLSVLLDEASSLCLGGLVASSRCTTISDCVVNDVYLSEKVKASDVTIYVGSMVGTHEYSIAIQNVYITNFNVDLDVGSNSDCYVGGYIGYRKKDSQSFTINNCIIENSSISVKVVDGDAYAGALLGRYAASSGESTITQCIADVKMNIQSSSANNYKSILVGTDEQKKLTITDVLVRNANADWNLVDATYPPQSFNDIIIEYSNGSKEAHYKLGDTEFSNWAITPEGKPIPKKLWHLGQFLQQASVDIIYSKGYTKKQI